MLKLALILTIRILCIGNSFSWDAVEHELVPLCDAANVDVEIHNLYYGGCSLEQHAQFLMKDTAAYSHRVCTNLSPSPLERAGERYRVVKDTISLRQALRDGSYDYISFQQASHDSGIRGTYEPWLSMLMDTVRAYQPDAQLCWMQTWAYSRDSKHPAYPRYHNDQQEMYDSIMTCLQIPKIGHRLPVIPCGTAIQMARRTKLGDTFCRDGYHLSPLGWYTAAAVWYEVITGKDVRRNPYNNPQLTKKQTRLLKKTVHKVAKEA